MKLDQGYLLLEFPLPAQTREWVEAENWSAVYEAFGHLTAPEGEIFKLLRGFCEFNSIELMISIREAQNEWEEDGIWHDDGSRVFAFSLSLTPDPREIEGGHVELRRKGNGESVLVPTPDFGTAICFLTGVWGYEHRTRKVENGKRIILVGWCS